MSPGHVPNAAPATLPEPAAPASGLSIATLPARIGLLRLLPGPLQMKAGLSPEVADAYVASWVTPRAVQTTLDESMGLGEGLRQAGAVTSLGAAPLIVLSRGLDQRQDWQQQQTELLGLSSNSQHVVATESGHT